MAQEAKVWTYTCVPLRNMLKLAHDLQADVLSRTITYALVVRGYYFVGGQLGEEKRPEPHAEVDIAI